MRGVSYRKRSIAGSSIRNKDTRSRNRTNFRLSAFLDLRMPLPDPDRLPRVAAVALRPRLLAHRVFVLIVHRRLRLRLLAKDNFEHRVRLLKRLQPEIISRNAYMYVVNWNRPTVRYASTIRS